MILSAVAYRWQGATLSRHRVITPSFLIKRVDTRGIFDDERPLSTIGRDTTSSRVRLSIVLDGRAVAFVGKSSWEVRDGQAVVVPLAGMNAITLAPTTLLELDWDASSGRTQVGPVALSPSFFETCHALALRLQEGNAERVAREGKRLLLQAAAMGLGPFDVDELSMVDEPNQAVARALDEALMALATQPQLVDLETRLSCSRWTLARSIRDLGRRYRLAGLGGATDWRSMRDFMRLRVAGIFMTHEQATTGAIARAVGYGSAEAMCHAFANAGLPSPGQSKGAPVGRI